MHIIAFSENTSRKQTLTFLTFFLHTLWTFMSSNDLWVLNHVVCPGEGMERKKIPSSKTLLLYYSSLCTLWLGATAIWPLWKFNAAADHRVSGIQTTSELLRESICHPASPENINGLTQARLGEGNNVFSFPWQASLYKIKFIFYLLKFWPKWRGTHWFFYSAITAVANFFPS